SSLRGSGRNRTLSGEVLSPSCLRAAIFAARMSGGNSPSKPLGSIAFVASFSTYRYRFGSPEPLRIFAHPASGLRIVVAPVVILASIGRNARGPARTRSLLPDRDVPVHVAKRRNSARRQIRPRKTREPRAHCAASGGRLASRTAPCRDRAIRDVPCGVPSTESGTALMLTGESRTGFGGRIPNGGRKVRVLGIPAIRDRVVQGALKLLLEPIFEADFQPGSFGYRPGRTA